MTMALSTKSITTFLSLNALESDQLARLLMGCITYKQRSNDSFECAAEAIKLCEQTLDILYTFQSPVTANKKLGKSNKHVKISNKRNMMPILPRDVLFDMCDYLDSFSKAHLRFTSMTTHIDMMGCPLDLIQKYDKKLSFPGLIPLVISCAPMKIIKRQPRNLCGCDASRQLQLFDVRTAKVNQTLCSDLTESQLSLLGIGRSWSITGIDFGSDNTSTDFIEMCSTLNVYNAFRSLKRLNFYFSAENQDTIDELHTLNTCGMGDYIENINICGEFNLLPRIRLSLKHIPSFKRLRCVEIQGMKIDGSLNDFVKYSPQIEKLKFNDTDITGDISCLSELKNIKVIDIYSLFNEYNYVYGDIGTLSSCTKLTNLSIKSKSLTGNISPLITLTNLTIFELNDTKVEGKIESLLKCLPKLKILDLFHNSNLTGELLLTSNVELEILNVFGADDLHLELSSLIHLKKLESIEIKGTPHVKNDISALSGLINLNSLIIFNCPQVTGSINSLTTLPNLGTLELGSLPNITGDASLFSHSIRGCGMCLHVGNCDNVKKI